MATAGCSWGPVEAALLALVSRARAEFGQRDRSDGIRRRQRGGVRDAESPTRMDQNAVRDRGEGPGLQRFKERRAGSGHPDIEHRRSPWVTSRIRPETSIRGGRRSYRTPDHFATQGLSY